MVNNEAWEKNWRSRNHDMTDALMDEATDTSKDVIRLQMLPCPECGGSIACLPGKPPAGCRDHQ